MPQKISVVINTLNEEKNIARAIRSINWADEIIVCDMYSDDRTCEIAKEMGAKVVFHKKVGYVEPARNFAISKASNDWIFILDADEEIPQSLADKIEKMLTKPMSSDYVRIPRKNIIFGRWMKGTGWWPDYNIRLFKKGKVEWSDEIHRPPKIWGQGLDLEADQSRAIVHHNYQNIGQFIERMNRYTEAEAKQLRSDGYQFGWKDLIDKPLSEFLSRFFARKGFEDGLHGLALSLLQAFSYLVVYLRVWEMEKFEEKKISINDLKLLKEESGKEINWWFNQISKGGFKKYLRIIKEKLS